MLTDEPAAAYRGRLSFYPNALSQPVNGLVMTYPSPFARFYDDAEALMMPWGDRVQVVNEVASLEVEYAAIRKSATLMDGAHRGLLKLTGNDRVDFVHRMVSNEVREMERGQCVRAFILNVKGRIIADLLIIAGDDCLLIDTDIHQADTVAVELDKLLFSEDVRIESLSESHHRISIHGPKAGEAFDQLDLPDGYRFQFDETGERGEHLWAPAASFKPELLESETVKPIGWGALNIARIEGGRPMFNIDFGSDSLPHETSVLDETVSFTKGCYRGQEVVARMQSLGHPAKVLVGFRAEGDLLPIAGTQVLDEVGADGRAVGAVTSSTYAPMMSKTPIGFAIVKWAHREVGTKLFAPSEGENVPIEVRPLRFYERATSDT